MKLPECECPGKACGVAQAVRYHKEHRDGDAQRGASGCRKARLTKPGRLIDLRKKAAVSRRGAGSVGQVTLLFLPSPTCTAIGVAVGVLGVVHRSGKGLTLPGMVIMSHAAWFSSLFLGLSARYMRKVSLRRYCSMPST